MLVYRVQVCGVARLGAVGVSGRSGCGVPNEDASLDDGGAQRTVLVVDGAGREIGVIGERRGCHDQEQPVGRVDRAVDWLASRTRVHEYQRAA